MACRRTPLTAAIAMVDVSKQRQRQLVEDVLPNAAAKALMYQIGIML